MASKPRERIRQLLRWHQTGILHEGYTEELSRLKDEIEKMQAAIDETHFAIEKQHRELIGTHWAQRISAVASAPFSEAPAAPPAEAETLPFDRAIMHALGIAHRIIDRNPKPVRTDEVIVAEALIKLASTAKASQLEAASSADIERESRRDNFTPEDQQCIDWLRRKASQLEGLLRDPQLGLMTWAQMFGKTMADISDFWTKGFDSVKDRR